MTAAASSGHSHFGSVDESLSALALRGSILASKRRMALGSGEAGQHPLRRSPVGPTRALNRDDSQALRLGEHGAAEVADAIPFPAREHDHIRERAHRQCMAYASTNGTTLGDAALQCSW